jgi:hypothetical protein
MSFEELLFWLLVLYWVWTSLFRRRRMPDREPGLPSSGEAMPTLEEALREIREALGGLSERPAPAEEVAHKRSSWMEDEEAIFRSPRFFDEASPPRSAGPSPVERRPPSEAALPRAPALPLHRDALRQAMLYREVLGPPRALRPWRPHLGPWEPGS